MSRNRPRNLPTVTDLLESPPLAGLVDRLSRNFVVGAAGRVLDEVCRELQTAATDRTLPNVAELAERIARRIVERELPELRSWINATGIVFHPELGSPPLGDAALDAMRAVAADYAGAGADSTGRGPPTLPAAVVERELCARSGAEAALVVNNGSAAMLLCLAGLASGREVVVARGQVVELDDGGRLPDLIEAAGAVLRAVGTTDRVHGDDYAQALSGATGAMLAVRRPSQAAATAGEFPLPELAALARKWGFPLICDIGFGPPWPIGLEAVDGEPNAADVLRAGAGAVLVRGNGLLGGPQSAVLMGGADYIERLRSHPMLPALVPPLPTIAALKATVKLDADPQHARYAIPTRRLLVTSPENLRNRAERLAPQMAVVKGIAEVQVRESATGLTGPSVSGRAIPTWQIVLRPKASTSRALKKTLSEGKQPVLTSGNEEHVVLDLRTVLPRQDIGLVTAVESAFRSKSDPSA